MSCKDDIHTLHAELIHKAADVQFQLAYDNAGNPATIECLDNGKNLQRLLEQFFSLLGIPKFNITPTGDKDRVNLTYTVVDEFIPETLVVYLSGDKLNGDQGDVDRDFDIITTGPNANKGFTLRLDPEQGHRLNDAPHDDEGLCCSYAKRVTYNTKSGT